ncbi:MAG TPA: NAD(P)/FAD-dependent oxidoreductase [Terriglobales bacterium]|nr:NAD(P)/FAD-dependent oxidoreductase [Terriglobales bacterium]
MPEQADIIVIGAGAAGLAATAELTRAGLDVVLLEARERLGGRIFTVRDPACEVPLELGAEFVHGRPPEITRFVRQGGLDLREVVGEDFCLRSSSIVPCDFFDDVEQLLSRMKGLRHEQSFDDFLAGCCPEAPEEIRRWTRAYIEGFNAADAGQISVQSLLREAEAEEEIDGDREFRVVGGYDHLLTRLIEGADRNRLALHTSTVVRDVVWSPGRVEVRCEDDRLFRARAAVITLPLGVLQSGDVHFLPELRDKRVALAQLVMGHVMRISLRFSERFWADAGLARRLPASLQDLRFLFTLGEWFPTWWTPAPVHAPVLTAWAPSARAEALSGQDIGYIVDKALETLAWALPVDRSELDDLFEQAYLHDWQADPFSRGSYSYVQVGGLEAQQTLADPVEQTLFFAGEATETEGHHATVHGAIATGHRAAGEALEALRVVPNKLNR